MTNMKYYLVENKSDDYGNCSRELVQTTIENANQYYSQQEIPDSDVEVLKRYFDFIDYDEEKERTEDQRFYGND